MAVPDPQPKHKHKQASPPVTAVYCCCGCSNQPQLPLGLFQLLPTVLRRAATTPATVPSAEPCDEPSATKGPSFSFLCRISRTLMAKLVLPHLELGRMVEWPLCTVPLYSSRAKEWRT
jgi:hypothetical protein